MIWKVKFSWTEFNKRKYAHNVSDENGLHSSRLSCYLATVELIDLPLQQKKVCKDLLFNICKEFTRLAG